MSNNAQPPFAREEVLSEITKYDRFIQNHEDGTYKIKGDQFFNEVEIQPGPDDSVATFVFHHESHTLGNALRYILMKNKNVSFCGYTVPHPLEPKMNLRLQTTGKSAVQVLLDGLDDLVSICDHIEEKFQESYDTYTAQQAEDGMQE